MALGVLKGGRRMLNNLRIGAVQIKFNERVLDILEGKLQ